MWLGLLAGCMGEHEQADEHFAFACDFQEANDMPVWAPAPIWAGPKRSPGAATRPGKRARRPRARAGARERLCPL